MNVTQRAGRYYLTILDFHGKRLSRNREQFGITRLRAPWSSVSDLFNRALLCGAGDQVECPCATRIAH